VVRCGSHRASTVIRQQLPAVRRPLLR
jgi:hypothetical protein